MDTQVKVKGQLRSYLRWPFILGIFLAIMVVILFLVDVRCGLIGLGCLVCYVIAAAMIYIRVRPIIVGELVKFALDYGQVQKALLHDLAIPYAVLDSEGRLLWANKSMQAITDTRQGPHGISFVFPELTAERMPADTNPVSTGVEIGGHYYRAEMSRVIVSGFSRDNALVDISDENYLITLYMFDETEIRRYIRENEEQHLVCGVILVDNYEEALNSAEDVRQSLLAALIERKITKYMQNYDAIVNKVEKDRYHFVIQNKYLKQLTDNRFSLLDEVREINIGNTLPVTLCIGIGAGAQTYQQSADLAKNAIELALGRGGDQAVVRDPSHTNFYGGMSKQMEKNTRVRARVKAHALRQLIEGKEQVVVMGHAMGDVDSFGASVGVCRIANVLNKKAYVVLDNVTRSVRPLKEAFDASDAFGPGMFLNRTQAMERVNQNTVLVIVDVSSGSRTEVPELLEKTPHIVVLDHHRQKGDTIDNAVLSYIEPYASSASEMVAEILQYVDERIKLRQAEADAMYAGVMIDTNNFLNKTGVRTFEAAAYLKKNGADVTRLRMMFRDDLDTFRVRAKSVSETELVDGCYAFARCDAQGLDTPSVIGAQVANALMDITGVKASFVFTPVGDTIYISARSMEEINVQLVMERLGGGGHSSIAGAQLKGTTVEDAMMQVKASLRSIANEGGRI